MGQSNIKDWLRRFRSAWASQDPNAAAALFADNAEYWETPFKRLASHDEILREWQPIRDQQDIQLDLEVFSSNGPKHAVLWNLTYQGADGNRRKFAGTYLITLNDQGLCTYFHHTGEAG
jgi:hypothetical protein